MQDKYPQEFDEQFISQAWLNMKQLLDKEMPVQQRRRPAWWLWLLAGLLLLAVLGGGAFYFYHGTKNPAPVDPAPQPTASLKQHSGADPAETEKNSETSLAEQKGGDKLHPDNQNREKAAVSRQPPAGPNSRRVPAGLKVPPAPPLPPPPAGYVPKQGEAGELAAQTKAQQEATSLLSDESTTPQQDKLTGPLALLPNDARFILPLTPLEGSTGGLPLSPTPKRGLTLRMAAEGGAVFLGHTLTGGYGGGLALEAGSRRSRLYWRTGAFFRSYRPDAASGARAIRLENSFTKEPLPDGSLVNSTSLLYTSTKVTNARFIQFPLLAGFRWKPRLALEAGLQAGFLLSAESASAWSLDDQNASSGGSQPPRPEIFGYAPENNSSIVNSTSLDVIAGLAYYPVARISLRLSYQHGLSDILAGRRDEAFLRGANLSLAYYIIQ